MVNLGVQSSKDEDEDLNVEIKGVYMAVYI